MYKCTHAPHRQQCEDLKKIYLYLRWTFSGKSIWTRDQQYGTQMWNKNKYSTILAMQKQKNCDSNH